MIILTSAKTKQKFLVNPQNIAFIAPAKKKHSKVNFNYSKGDSGVSITVTESLREISELL